MDLVAAKPFDPPSRGTLAPDAMSARALRFLAETGEVVELSAEVVLAADAVGRARAAVVAFIHDHGSITVSDARQQLGSSRRVLVPLLEYLDRIGVTVRDGEGRTLRR